MNKLAIDQGKPISDSQEQWYTATLLEGGGRHTIKKAIAMTKAKTSPNSNESSSAQHEIPIFSFTSLDCGSNPE